METLTELFNNPDILADYATQINLSASLEIIRSDRISSKDSSEQGGYFCAVSKKYFSSIGNAYPLLFIHDLYDSQEWDKNKPPFNNFNEKEWKTYLSSIWIPEYLAINETGQVLHKTVYEADFRADWLQIANPLAELAFQSPIQTIIRYGMIEAWNFSDYLIETETEYIDFQYWTTA